MVKLALLVRCEIKPGKESEAAEFFRGALPLAEAEPDTTLWFAIKIGDSTYGVFDAFETEEGRQAHLNGKIAAALFEKAPDLFSSPPSIEKVDILAEKLP